MLFILLSFIAGFLTVLAPCVLPLLPVIIGGSLTGDNKDRKRPLIIIGALAVSLIVFTLLLKATTLLIDIPPRTITIASGILIVILGVLLLLPGVYAKLLLKTGIEHRSQALLGKGFANKKQYVGPALIGVALGPVFSSCSPVYGYILATVLPVNFGEAILYMVAYIIGLSSVLLLIGYYGQRFVSKLKFASNPKGVFQRVIAVLFIIVGLLVATGYDKRAQTWVSEHTPFKFDALSAKFIPSDQKIDNSKGYFNVEPYQAPEFSGLQNWINSQPLNLSDQKGKVVLVDFWTYSCINCIRNNPYIEKWYEAYKDQGFIVVGVHAPEFAFERNADNVRKAVKDQGLTYPIALDNEFSTWAAFENNYWPAGYLIDAEGNIRRVHYGEGEYEQSEMAIRALLEEKGAQLNDQMTVTNSSVPSSSKETPETYLGSKRASNFIGSSALAKAPTQTFVVQDGLKKNQWSLGGTWEVQSEKIIARGNSVLRFNVAAKEVYLVTGASSPTAANVMLNGQPIKASQSGSDVTNAKLIINENRLYKITKFNAFEESNILELSVPNGVELNVFTFGS